MIHPLSTSLIDTLKKRRSSIQKQLGSAYALIPSGEFQVRNFRANTHSPYRASSHFLYVMAHHIPHGVCLLTPNETRLYLPPPSFSETLWHGPSPTFKEIEVWVGCHVRSLEFLERDLAQCEVYTLPSAQMNTQAYLSSLLGRTPTLESELPLVNAIIQSRLIHDDEAIDGLKRAAERTDAAHRAGMKATRVGRWVHEIKAAMESETLKVGMSTAYAPIITPHGEVLHNHEYHVQLQEGDLLLVDFGAEDRQGWAGDVTRTWPVSGQWSSTQRAIYDIVLNSLKQTSSLVKPGVEYRDLHACALRVLTEGLVDLGIIKGSVEQAIQDQTPMLFFPHGVGHLLGLDVHDMEDLGDYAGYASGRQRDSRFGWGYLRLNRPLQAGMAITIEPGFYQVEALLKNPEVAGPNAGKWVNWDRLAEFKDVRGIRIEDDLLVTSNGSLLLSPTPKEGSDILELMG